MPHANDIPGLEAAVDPDGSLRKAFDEATPREHDWLLSVLIPLAPEQLRALEDGSRLVFKNVDPRDVSTVRGSGVFCGRCQLQWEQMTETERERCRA